MSDGDPPLESGGHAGPPFDPERFRREGREVVDWIASYWESLASRPVRSQVAPGWVRSELPPHAPEDPEPLTAVVADLDRVRRRTLDRRNWAIAARLRAYARFVGETTGRNN